MDRTTLGSAIFTELRNPTLTPLQSSPVHAVLQARTQASKFRLAGNTKSSPCRISGIVLSDVTIITNSGRRKNAADTARNTYSPILPSVMCFGCGPEALFGFVCVAFTLVYVLPVDENVPHRSKERPR